MAQGRRVERLGSLIRREISELLNTGIRDARVHQGMVSITRVEVAGDLQHSKIFVSVYGTEEQQRQALEGLKAATPFVRGELGRRMRLRRIPELVFLLDRGLERGTAVLGLLQQLERERLLRQEGEVPPEGEATPENQDAALLAPLPPSVPADVDVSDHPPE
jgi:ribosome-binding factor A